ncbi:MAG: hypothetical protein LBU40_03355 [Methanobrevibacter sp.]|nr:hypothetical protein [Methanobrevibacter sp.]
MITEKKDYTSNLDVLNKNRKYESIKQIITGQTGSGKTYTVINKAKRLGSFVYVAPCRQLVYETLLKYGNKEDTLSTGEISRVGKNNCYAVYESLNHLDLKKYDSLIIDEAHFLTDKERNQVLLETMENYKGNIFLCTATDNFSSDEFVADYNLIELPTRVSFKKLKISEEAFFKRVELGEPSIYFHKYEKDCGEFGGKKITGQTSCENRLKYQLQFERGEITFIECTNVLAQGVNFPATNVLIEYNLHDSAEIIYQKIGRLGRMGFGHSENTVMTYCCFLKEKPKIHKKKIKKEVKNVDLTQYWIRVLNERNILDKRLLKDLKNLNEYEALNFDIPVLNTYNMKTLDVLCEHDVNIEDLFDSILIEKYNQIKKSRNNLALMIEKELEVKNEL